MADGKTVNYSWWLPEDHINSNLWGGYNNSNWSDADTKVYANQQAVAAIQGQTSTTTVSTVQVASTASASASVNFTNSRAPAGQQLRWQWAANNVAEATGNVGSDIFLNSFTNTGTFLRTNIAIVRSTGAMSFTGAMAFGGAVTFSGAATFTTTLSCKTAINITAASTSDNALTQFFNSASGRRGYCGWVNSGDQVVIASDSGAYVSLTSTVGIHGNVTGTGTASFTGISATGNIGATGSISAGGNIGTTGSISANGAISSNSSIAGATLTSAGAMTVSGSASVAGSLTASSIVAQTSANPIVSLNDGGGNRTNLFFDTSIGATYLNNVPTTTNIRLDNLGSFGYFGGTGTAYKNGGGSWTAVSDERIKTVTGEYELGLEEVLQLRPVFYRYKGNDSGPNEPKRTTTRQFVGFVAQELERVMPGMVNKREGYLDGQRIEDMRDVDTSELVFALVNCVKELKAEIEALKAK